MGVCVCLATCHFGLFIWGVRGYIWLGPSFLQLSQACGRKLLEVSVSRLPKRPSRGSEQQLAASRQLAPGETSEGALKRVAAYWGHTAVSALQRPGNPSSASAQLVTKEWGQFVPSDVPSVKFVTYPRHRTITTFKVVTQRCWFVVRGLKF